MDRRNCLKSVLGFSLGSLGLARVYGDQTSGGSSSTVSAAGPAGLSQPHKLLTIRESIELAGQNLLLNVDPDQDFLPYWEMRVTHDYKAQLGKYWTAHNLGRWLDAMLRLEEAIGFRIPEKMVEAFSRNMRAYFDNPDHICLCPNTEPKVPYSDEMMLRWDLHSLREGMLGLNALARWRKDSWAVEMGRKMIASVDSKLGEDGKWDITKFDASKRGLDVIHNLNGCDTHGRMLEAVLWFYETTGDVSALRFADRLARLHLEQTTTEDGTINPASNADHTHSYLGTLRGLLLYGQLTKQHQYVERVAKAYQVNVPKVVHPSGYSSHNMVQESLGETSSGGDSAQIALWLAKLGYGENLDDVERIVRARIMPSQILETPPLTPLSDKQNDSTRDLSQRVFGAYGGCHGRPHSRKKPVTDVTAATLHSMIDIYRNIAWFDAGRLSILFHLDYEDERVKVAPQRKDGLAELQVEVKKPSPVAVRVPGFAPRESVKVKVGDKEIDPVIVGNFLELGALPAGTKVRLNYALPKRTTHERGQGTDYEIAWRGDDVVGIRPNDTFYPFYPSL